MNHQHICTIEISITRHGDDEFLTATRVSAPHSACPLPYMQAVEEVEFHGEIHRLVSNTLCDIRRVICAG